VLNILASSSSAAKKKSFLALCVFRAAVRGGEYPKIGQGVGSHQRDISGAAYNKNRGWAGEKNLTGRFESEAKKRVEMGQLALAVQYGIPTSARKEDARGNTGRAVGSNGGGSSIHTSGVRIEVRPPWNLVWKQRGSGHTGRTLDDSISSKREEGGLRWR